MSKQNSNRVIIVVKVRCPSIQLQQLDVDKPLLLPIGHQPGILVTGSLVLMSMMVITTRVMSSPHLVVVTVVRWPPLALSLSVVVKRMIYLTQKYTN